jgi:DNA polymerase delta subunit 2
MHWNAPSCQCQSRRLSRPTTIPWCSKTSMVVCRSSPRPDCDLRVHQFVTGVVLALVGEEIDGGDLLVHSVIEPGCPPQLPLRDPTPLPRLVAFVSDLAIGTADGELALRHELLSDFLLSSPLAPRIGRLVVAGNLIARPPPPTPSCRAAPSRSRRARSRSWPRPSTRPTSFSRASAPRLWSTSCRARKTRRRFALPQQPLNMCLFPVASHFPSLSATTNPYEATFDGVRLSATAARWPSRCCATCAT